MTETITVFTRAEFINKLAGARLLKVAAGSGVSYPTLRRMQKGESDNINLSVRKKVTDFFLKGGK